MDGCESAENDPYKVSMNSGKTLEILKNDDQELCQNFSIFFQIFGQILQNLSARQQIIAHVNKKPAYVMSRWSIKFGSNLKYLPKFAFFQISIVFNKIFLDSRVDPFSVLSDLNSWNPLNSLQNGFSFVEKCPPKPNHGLYPSPLECCGDYPHRFPFKDRFK